MANELSDFIAGSPINQWRGIVLFGRNVASYKFALAKSLLDLGREQKEEVSLAELSVPFSRYLCEHIKEVDTQGTSPQSRPLDACRFYNAGKINSEELLSIIELLGFNDVIDAFHNVGPGEVATKFYIDERNTRINGIRLTDSIFKLSESFQTNNLYGEVESRWNLVEEAWSKKADGKQSRVLYESSKELLIPALKGKRHSITEVRPALNGYQKGHCFYCFRRITIFKLAEIDRCHVDHFLPHSLMARGFPLDLDKVWNLVLSCPECNLSKSSRLPDPNEYLERLNKRNNFLISSHHPLRETLISETGNSQKERILFLRKAFEKAFEIYGATVNDGWKTKNMSPPLF